MILCFWSYIVCIIAFFFLRTYGTGQRVRWANKIFMNCPSNGRTENVGERFNCITRDISQSISPRNQATHPAQVACGCVRVWARGGCGIWGLKLELVRLFG